MNMLRISEVSISLIKPKDGLVGFAALVICDALYISGIAIHRKLDGNGYRLTYPTRKSSSQSFDVYHPISRAAGKAIEAAIFEKLNDVLNRLDHAGHDCPDAA